MSNSDIWAGAESYRPARDHQSLVGNTGMETENHHIQYVISKGAREQVPVKHRRRDHLCQGGLRKGKGGRRRGEAFLEVWECGHDRASSHGCVWV